MVAVKLIKKLLVGTVKKTKKKKPSINDLVQKDLKKIKKQGEKKKKIIFLKKKKKKRKKNL